MSKYAEYQTDMAYRIYITDSLYYYSENKRLAKRYEEIIRPQPEDHRSGDQIALDVITKLGLKWE